MWPNLKFPADLVTLAEEILNEKLHFLWSVTLWNADKNVFYTFHDTILCFEYSTKAKIYRHDKKFLFLLFLKKKVLIHSRAIFKNIKRVFFVIYCGNIATTSIDCREVKKIFSGYFLQFIVWILLQLALIAGLVTHYIDLAWQSHCIILNIQP